LRIEFIVRDSFPAKKKKEKEKKEKRKKKKRNNAENSGANGAPITSMAESISAETNPRFLQRGDNTPR